MPLQLLLDISTASARSKGQARRRNQPAASEDARKAQRNLVRRERAKCKKAGETKQQLLPSPKSFPPASRPQHGLPSPSADNVVESVPEMPLLPSPLVFTEPPGQTDDSTLRAMGQSSRYSTAKSKVQYTKAAVREVVQRVDDFSTLKASNRAKSQTAPQEQDLNAAGILLEVAREQHPTSTVRKSGNLSVIKGVTSDANTSLHYTRKCPFPSCAYHLDRGFWSKTETDHHIMTHFEGHIEFVTNGNRHSLPWPSFIEDPANFFPKIEILKRRVRQYYVWHGYGGDPEDSTCAMCLCSFDLSGYVKHLDDCIVHALQVQALGTAQACPLSTCEHDPPKFSWGPLANESIIKHFVPSLGCSRCYAIQCRCPPMQQTRLNLPSTALSDYRKGFEKGFMKQIKWLATGKWTT